MTPALFILASATINGLSGVFIRTMAMPPATGAFFRMVVPAVGIGCYFWWSGRRFPTTHLRMRLIASTLNALRLVLYFVAYAYTTFANAAIILYSWPIFAALFGHLFLGERVAPRRAALLALAFTGIPFLSLGAIGSGATEGTGHLFGMGAMLVSAIMFSVSLVLLKHATAGESHFETTFFQNLVGAIIFLPGPFVTGLAYSPLQISTALFYGAFVGIGGFTLFFVGLHRSRTAAAANLSYFEVVVSILAGYFIYGEALRWNTAVGGVIIIAAVLLSRTVRD